MEAHLDTADLQQWTIEYARPETVFIGEHVSDSRRSERSCGLGALRIGTEIGGSECLVDAT